MITMALESSIFPIRFEQEHLVLLDQRYLPATHQDLTCETIEQATQAIADLVVRGAPAIGITAAYAVYLGYQQKQKSNDYDMETALENLINARPTAVNLCWAVQQQKIILHLKQADVAVKLLQNAQAIHQQDLQANYKLGQFGAELIDPGSRVLTHCNAGALATAGYGTALGVIRTAWSESRLQSVYASETRPWLQGLRLTAWELAQDNIPVKVIVEGAVSSLFRLKDINWVIVGADRICANGDVINKVGTANLAIMARHYGVSMMVVAPTSTIDMLTESGEQVEIEFRAQDEILGDYYASNESITGWNPVFDVTPASLVNAIVTEKGVVLLPDRAKMKTLMSQKDD